MNIDVRILIFRPTIVNASQPLPVFIPYPQVVDVAPRAVPHPAPPRKLTLASLLRSRPCRLSSR
jgi:hypothetical protein